MKNNTNKLIYFEEYIPINGISQYLFHCGTDYKNPVLLILHGGPGSAESIFSYTFQEKWENIFTVVHWDQRGAGKTLTENPDEDTFPTTEILLNDLKEICDYLKKKYNKKKIILGIIASYAFCNIFLVPILSIVSPYFINIFLNLSSKVYGIVEAICVLGMILGGFFISIKPNLFSIKKVHYTYYPMILGVTIMTILGFIKLNNYIMAGIFAFSGMLIMFSLALSNVLTLTFIQKEVPLNMLGRVSAFSTAIATISVAPGQLLFGQVIDKKVPLGIIFIVALILNFGLILFNKWNVKNI